MKKFTIAALLILTVLFLAVTSKRSGAEAQDVFWYRIKVDVGSEAYDYIGSCTYK